MSEMEILKQKIARLEQEIENFKSYSTISFEVGEAIKSRVFPNGQIDVQPSSGSPATVTINESGSSVIVAQAPLTGKLLLRIGKSTYIIPTL